MKALSFSLFKMQMVAFNSYTYRHFTDLKGHAGLFTATNCTNNLNIELTVSQLSQHLNSQNYNMSQAAGKILRPLLLGSQAPDKLLNASFYDTNLNTGGHFC